MGLTKNCTLASGVVVGYFEIEQMLFKPRQNLCLVNIEGYISEAAKFAGATPAYTNVFRFDTTNGPLVPGVFTLVNAKLAAAIDAGSIL